MNSDVIAQLFEVARTKNQYDENNSWFQDSQTYFREMHLELQEVSEEITSGRTCHLEDELGDVLWDYLNFLLSLENEGRIQVERVFERAFRKYSERMDGLQQGKTWAEIKAKQKERLASEQAHMEKGVERCQDEKS